MIDIWLTCCRLAGGAYYWQHFGMFGLLMNMMSPCLQRILYKVTVILFDNSMTWLTYDYCVVTLLAEHTIDNNSACLILHSCLCFASYKYSHHSIIIATSFGHTFSASTSFQFVSGWVCVMVITRYHKYARVGTYVPHTNTRMIFCVHACTWTNTANISKPTACMNRSIASTLQEHGKI